MFDLLTNLHITFNESYIILNPTNKAQAFCVLCIARVCVYLCVWDR